MSFCCYWQAVIRILPWQRSKQGQQDNHDGDEVEIKTAHGINVNESHAHLKAPRGHSRTDRQAVSLPRIFSAC